MPALFRHAKIKLIRKQILLLKSEPKLQITLFSSEDPQMCAENAQRIICYIKQLEINQQVNPKFLSGSKITGKVRGVLINWLSEVHCQFKLMQETLYMAVGIVDR